MLDFQKQKTIWKAIADRDVQSLQDALTRGEDPNQKDEKGLTPLLKIFKTPELMSYQQILNKAFMNPEEREKEQSITFQLARSLLIAGADVNAYDPFYHWTSLHWLCVQLGYENQIFVVLLLSCSMTDVNAKDIDGYTPLYFAVRNQRPDLMQLLQEKGAVIDENIQELLNKQEEEKAILDRVDPRGDLRLQPDQKDLLNSDNVFPILRNVYLALEKTDYNLKAINITGGQLALLTVNQLLNEVHNGGFHQYFFNPSGDWAKYALKALPKMWANEYAELLHKALQIMGDRYIADRRQRIPAMKSITEEEMKALNELDQIFYNQKKELDEYIWWYIRALPNEFVIPG